MNQRKGTTMNEQNMQELGEASLRMVYGAAKLYLTTQHLTADPERLAVCCKAQLKVALPEALADAREALVCHNPQLAETTFKASLVIAGIEAAKAAVAEEQAQRPAEESGRNPPEISLRRSL